MNIGALIDQLLSRVGDLWTLAFVGSFFVMICEASKPKPRDGETAAEPRGFGLLVNILSILTPLLLFVHAFAEANGAVMAVLVLLGGAVLGSALIGWALAATARDIAHVLNRASPALAVAVFGLTLYVSWRSAFNVLNFLVASFAR
jgi:hypothetical protein